MIWGPPWAVLAPGEPAWLEHHARAALGLVGQEDGDEVKPPFKVVPGGSRYHAIIGLDGMDVGAEMQIAGHLSLQCAEPVYSIEEASPPPAVFEYRGGVEEMLEVEPRELARSLGCPFPENPEGNEPPIQEAANPLRTVALAEGVRAEEALRVLEQEAGQPLSPGRYRCQDTPGGLLIAGGSGDLGFADTTLSERFPQATVYGVAASPSLDIFIVDIIRGGEGIGQFAQPSDYKSPFQPPVSEIKGERTPERILAALGIPAEWFR